MAKAKLISYATIDGGIRGVDLMLNPLPQWLSYFLIDISTELGKSIHILSVIDVEDDDVDNVAGLLDKWNKDK